MTHLSVYRPDDFLVSPSVFYLGSPLNLSRLTGQARAADRTGVLPWSSRGHTVPPCSSVESFQP
jgi:hypothetical protein